MSIPKLLALCLFPIVTGCATVHTTIDATERFPGYTMRSTVFGSAKMLESAQEFHGQLVVKGDEVSVEITNGQQTKGMEASGIQEITQGVVSGIVKVFVPIPTLEPLVP